MNNENKKSQRSVFNAIDVAILLLILICAVGIERGEVLVVYYRKGFIR